MNRGYWNPPKMIETSKLGRYQSVSLAAGQPAFGSTNGPSRKDLLSSPFNPAA